MDIESEALARKRAREGYNYQQERGMDVMQSAAGNEGSAASGLMGAGMGLGMGVGMGGAFGAGFSSLANQAMGAVAPMAGTAPASASMQNGPKCPSCGNVNPMGAKFCLECGQKLEQGVACPACGHLNPLGAKFCLECGTRLASPKCPSCGAELPEGTKFCPDCGTKIQ